jgi:ABC-type uncharacterized transport system involved in gliding motility auxiliary subunit
MNPKKTGLLWILEFVFALIFIFSRTVFSEMAWLTLVTGVPLLIVTALLVQHNRQSLKGRTAAYGLNSAVTILLVLGIVGVLNFLGSRYSYKLDLTKNKTHSLSEQTIKIVKDLKTPIKANFFSKPQDREKYRLLLDNYKGLNPKFDLEMIDPNKEPERAKAANVIKYNTLQLINGTRTANVDEPTEEKITNALIKVLKERSQTFCAITGHGEHSLSSNDQDGMSAIKTALTSQSYIVKEVALLQENKIPDDCDAIAILGPSKTYFKNEIDLISAYLGNGGRAVITFDANVKGPEMNEDLIKMLENWNLKVDNALILSKRSLTNLGPSAIVIQPASTSNPITKDFKMASLFLSARPIDTIPGGYAGIHTEIIAKSLPDTFAFTNLAALAKGGELKIDPASQKAGPFGVAAIADGKLKITKATKNTRIVLFGTTLFAVNTLAGQGGNLDFFLNSAAWAMEDESFISIRPKEAGPGHVELGLREGASTLGGL